MWLVPLMPFCKLISQPIVAHGIPWLDMMYIETSLWDLNIVIKCSTRIPVYRDAALWACEKMKPMIGRHKYSHVHQYACNLEEQTQRTMRFGCDQLNIISYASKIVVILWALAALTQLCAAVNSYMFAATRPKQFDIEYLEKFDHERMQRRAIMVTFYVAAPIIGTTGFIASVFIFDLSNLVMPMLLKPLPGILYPIAWGSVWVIMTSVMSIFTCIFCFCTVNDDEPTNSEMGSDGENEELLQEHEDPYGMRYMVQTDPYGQSAQQGGFGNPNAPLMGDPYAAPRYGADPYGVADPYTKPQSHPAYPPASQASARQFY